jgi:F-type H+-transporting ATPase subunit c
MDLLLALIPPIIEGARVVAQDGGESTKIAISDDGVKFIGAGIAMGLGAFGPALAIGNLVGRAMEALGRNPEAQPVIQTNMILGLAFAEAIGIYALVTAVMIGFVF